MARDPRRRCLLEVDGELHEVDLSRGHDLAIPLRFDDTQHDVRPSAFGLGYASMRPVEGEEFVGDVSRGGALNCFQVTFWPHGHGTHTETVGHITTPPPPVGQAIPQALIPATVLTVSLASLGECEESYPWRGLSEDQVITRGALERAFALCSASTSSSSWNEALVLRTLPNDTTKKGASYSGQNPAYLTREAMAWVREQGVEHLLVDLPSVDREEDDGELGNHHLFWGLAAGETDPEQAEGPWRTITEMIYVPEDVVDGTYLLSLQVPHFILDAAPSRPLLYPITKPNLPS